jgi:hypothetical protein
MMNFSKNFHKTVFNLKFCRIIANYLLVVKSKK